MTVRPGPTAAAEWVRDSFDPTHRPIDPRRHLIDFSLEQKWFSEESVAAEECARWQKTFCRLLVKFHDEAVRRTGYTRFVFNESNGYLQGSLFIGPGDSAEIVSSKKNRLLAVEYLAAIKALTPRHFEGLCGQVLRLLGCSTAIVTRSGRDQGIDFHGQLPLRGALKLDSSLPQFGDELEVWLAGQAKQYSGEVGPADIREFVGSIELAVRRLFYDGGSALSDFSAKPYGGLLNLFVTSGAFTSAAIKLLDETGILALDGSSLAALLADHSVAHGPSLVLDEARFKSWAAAGLS